MEVYPHQIAFNALPQVDSFLETGYTKEEMKFQNEGRKMMHLPDFCASVTCVRVPVYRAHSVAISAEFDQPVSLDAARDALAKAPDWIWLMSPSPIATRCRSIAPGRIIARSDACASIARSKTGSAFGCAETNCLRAPR